MKRFFTWMAAMAVFGLVLGGAAWAQLTTTWKGGGGWGAGAPYGRLYNPKTVETVGGKVISVDKIIPLKGMSYGVHLTLQADNETISVHLGPVWYIDNQPVKIVPGDKVEITGSRITFEGKPALIASEVKKGAEVLRLRDANGAPAWSHWHRR